MPVRKPRSRLVYFRVSEDEFDEFTQMCEREGARCLSDLVRSAMRRAAAGAKTNGDEPVAARLKQLDDRVSEMAVSLQELASLIQEQSGNGGHGDRKLQVSEKGRANAEFA